MKEAYPTHSEEKLENWYRNTCCNERNLKKKSTIVATHQAHQAVEDSLPLLPITMNVSVDPSRISPIVKVTPEPSALPTPMSQSDSMSPPVLAKAGAICNGIHVSQSPLTVASTTITHVKVKGEFESPDAKVDRLTIMVKNLEKCLVVVVEALDNLDESSMLVVCLDA